MKHVSAAEANRSFSKLLADVKGGESVTITSHGEPVARLVPISDKESALKALAREEARKLLWERLRSQPALNLGKMTRNEIYEEIL